MLLAMLIVISGFTHAPAKEVVEFKNGNILLHGIVYRPTGKGPFPAVLYNHGSAPGMLNDKASDELGPLFANKGWVFFMPHRRGQGLSASAGPYVMDVVNAAEKKGGQAAAAATMVHLLETDHLKDQLAGLDWLKKRDYIARNRIAAMGNSFGGIETVLGAKNAKYCAAVNASGGAMSWERAPELRKIMTEAVRISQAPIFFFQAENDFDLSPSKILSAEMKKAGRESEVKFYPSYGQSPSDGHSFAYLGSSIWSADVFAFLNRLCK